MKGINETEARLKTLGDRWKTCKKDLAWFWNFWEPLKKGSNGLDTLWLKL
jgi:hypothetical protein